jgi:Tfp pilus assembly protein PilO
MKGPVLLKQAPSAVSLLGWVARINRLRWHLGRQWGWPGLIGLLLLALTIGLSWHTENQLAQQEQDLLRAKVAQLSALQRLQTSQTQANRRDPRDEARDTLPAVTERGVFVRKVLQQAEASGLALARVDYVAQPEEPGLQRLRVTLPVSGSYAQLRRFISRLLNQMPQVALDGLQLDRPAEQPEQLNATIRLSVFFRGEPR